MTTKHCLTEQDLLDLFYNESESPAEARHHLDACPSCRASYTALERQMKSVSDPLPNGGDRALAGALKMLGLSTPLETSKSREAAPVPTASTGSAVLSDDILTLSEVAAYLRVDLEQARSLLVELPHLNIGGAIRVRRPALEAFLRRMEAESTRRPMLDALAPINRRYDLI